MKLLALVSALILHLSNSASIGNITTQMLGMNVTQIPVINATPQMPGMNVTQIPVINATPQMPGMNVTQIPVINATPQILGMNVTQIPGMNATTISTMYLTTIPTMNATTIPSTTLPVTNATTIPSTTLPVTNATTIPSTTLPVTNATTMPSTTLPVTNATKIPITIPLTALNPIKGFACYQAEYAFDDLNPIEVLEKMDNEVEKHSAKVIVWKWKFSNATSLLNDTMCGVVITKNKTSNNYNFKYGFFKTDYCTSNDTICKNGATCVDTAMKCCKDFSILPCNLYSIVPNNNTECMKANNTNCFQIKSIENQPTAFTTNAVAEQSMSYTFAMISTILSAFFANSIK